MGETSNFCLLTHAQRRRFQLDPLVHTKLYIHCTCVHHFAQFTHFKWPLHAQKTLSTQQHSPFILQLQLCSIGKARSAGGEGEQHTMLTIAKQDEEATLFERPRLQTAFAVILLLHFLSLREICAPEQAVLLSNAHNAHQTLKRVHS